MVPKSVLITTILPFCAFAVIKDEIINKIKQIKNKFKLCYFYDNDYLSDYIYDVLIYIYNENINTDDLDLKMEILDYIIENSGSSKYSIIKHYINSIFSNR